jgi:WD40 repeat protein
MKKLLGLICAALFHASAAPTPITALAFSPDGKLLAVGAYQQVQLWESGHRRPIAHFAGQVRALAFRDSRTLAVADGVPGRSGSVSILDLETGAVTPVQQSKDEMLAVAFSPDGKLLATGGTDGVVRIYEGNALKKELKSHTDWISGLAFSPDGKLLASASADRTVGVWLTSTWTEEFQLPTQPTEPVRSLAFSLEGDLLAFATGGPDEHAIRLWRTQGAFTEIDPTRPNMKTNLAQTRPSDTGACVPLSIVFVKSQPRSRMLAGCSDKTVRLLGNGGNPIATLNGPADWIYAVAATPDGQTIASASADGAVHFWIASGQTFKPAPETKP